MQEVILDGRLTKDPTTSANGATYGSIAVKRPGKAKEGAPDTDFFDYVGFKQTGEFMQKYLRKGNRVLIEGRFENNKFTDREGKERIKTQLIINRVESLDPKKTTAAEEDDEFAPSEPFPADDDEMPFC